ISVHLSVISSGGWEWRSPLIRIKLSQPCQESSFISTSLTPHSNQGETERRRTQTSAEAVNSERERETERERARERARETRDARRMCTGPRGSHACDGTPQ